MSQHMLRADALEGHHICITGGGTGLGKEMAAECSQLGARVTICGRRGQVVEETAAEITSSTGNPVHALALDIRSQQDVDAFVEDVFAIQPLTGLINNAAGNFVSPTKDISPRGFDAISSIVFNGTFYVTQAVGKRWIEQGIPGSVVSILATWVWTGSPFVVASAMSKSGINAMTKSLAVEWGQYGIRLNAVAPGPFPTEGAWARLRVDDISEGDSSSRSRVGGMARNGEMQELRNLCAFLLADGCQYLTGQTIAIDGAHHLTGGGTFSEMGRLSDDDWARAAAAIRATNQKDKEKRTV